MKKKIASLVLVFAMLTMFVPSRSVVNALTPNSSIKMSSSYKSGPYYTKLLNVTLSGNGANDIVAVAKSQIGYKSGSSNSDMSGVTSSTSNVKYSEYGYAIGSNPNDWCAYFVSWCARQANISANVLPNFAGCSAGYNTTLPNANCVMHTKASGYKPKKGDIIFFLQNDWSHVGIVSQDTVDNTVHYIDGNNNHTTPHCVHDSTMILGLDSDKSYKALTGYATPNYNFTPVTHTRNTNYGTNFKATAKAKQNAQDENHNTLSNHWVSAGDPCVINEVYTDGCCKVTYPAGDGTATYFFKISNFEWNTSSHTRDTNYGTNFKATAKAKQNAQDENHNTLSNHWVSAGDPCVINEVYTDGCCKVTYPAGDGTATYFFKISNFEWNTSSHTRDTNYGTNFKATAKAKQNAQDENHNTLSNHWVSAGDPCVINEVYTDGCCKVTYPAGDGTATYFFKISNFEWNTSSHTRDTNYGTNFKATAKAKQNAQDENHNTLSNHWVSAGDPCVINEVYTDGCCKVTYPAGDGTATYFFKISNFEWNTSSHTRNTNYGTNFSATAKIHIDVFNEDHTDPGNYYIDPGDPCIIHEVYTDGCCKVTYPSESAPNKERTYYCKFNSTNFDWSSPVPDNSTPVNLGTDFYANIVSVNANKYVTNDSNNVCIRSNSGGNNQIWKFERQSDNSYKIISALDNKVMDVDNASNASSANVQVWDDNGTAAQRWLVYGTEGSYQLKAQCTDCRLDVQGGNTVDGTNVFMWEKNNSQAQNFNIVKTNLVTPSTNIHGNYEYAVVDGMKITVVGWAYDTADTSKGTGIQIYADDANGNQQYIGGGGASESRQDVDDQLHVGVNHGFCVSVDALRTGTYNVYVYAISVDGKSSKLLGSKQVTVEEDTDPPVISDIQVTVEEGVGYTVICKVTDNVSVSRVRFPTWTENNGQDDLVQDWGESALTTGEKNGDIYTYHVKISDHNNELGVYRTHIYAWDGAGNYAVQGVGKVTVTDISTYTITYNANGGKNAPSAQTKTHGKNLTLSSTEPTRDNYTFLGWSENKNATTATYTSGAVFSEDKDATLYAIWQKNASTHTPGDINGDGSVNNKDLTRLMKYIAGENVEVVEAALDVNGDGTVNNKDLTRLMKYLAGAEVAIN